MTTGAIELSILIPAFLAGLLVLSTHVPMGQQVLGRGIVFIDLSIAQVAGLGVTIAGALGSDPKGWTVQAAACGAALVGALLLTWTEKKWPDVQEAQIGVLFVLAATAGILLLAKNPHGGEHLRDLLAGQILWVSYAQLAIPLVITLAILGLWFGARALVERAGFYLLFALAVTVSVQLVGVYLVFATLIVPSLGTRQHRESRRLALAYGIGVAGYAIGLALSSAFDLPAGALIVWCLALLSMAVHAVSRSPDANPGRI